MKKCFLIPFLLLLITKNYCGTSNFEAFRNSSPQFKLFSLLGAGTLCSGIKDIYSGYGIFARGTDPLFIIKGHQNYCFNLGIAVVARGAFKVACSTGLFIAAYAEHTNNFDTLINLLRKNF